MAGSFIRSGTRRRKQIHVDLPMAWAPSCVIACSVTFYLSINQVNAIHRAAAAAIGNTSLMTTALCVAVLVSIVDTLSLPSQLPGP